MMPEWFISPLIATPSILWIVAGVGIAWALVALPRRDWRNWPLVVCVALTLGPAWLTAWMLVLGTLGQNTAHAGFDSIAGDPINPMQSRLMDLVGGESLLRPDLILMGTVIIALIGWGLVWWRASRTPGPERTPHVPLAFDERILIALIVIATVGRWFITSWVSFGSWDELWVYGYQGRIYTLLGFIPTDIGYYPQFMPLQFAYTQIINFGAINDSAARAVVPFVQVGSILAAYVLGRGLFNRRTGIFTAALWALYPHFGYWTRVADLEIPLAFGFTGAAAFFLMAWVAAETALRRRYAVVAGLFLGVAMWTKPTGGGFIWGVVLVVALDLLRTRFDWRAWYPRFEVAFLTGVACIPLGAVWYIRNVFTGHEAITFPPSVWLTRAMRSGQEFGWPLLALAVLLAYLYLAPARFRPNRIGVLVGVVLIALGIVPTIIEPARMAWMEWLALGAGMVVLGATLADFAFANLGDAGRRDLSRAFWAAALALPYFITWFYSYSYHYRLSFAIVPLMALPTAVIVARWFTVERLASWRVRRRIGYAGLVVALGLPGVAVTIYDEGAGWDWLWTIPPQGDFSEAALLGVVDHLERYQAEGGDMVIVAPGMQTLQFFFPTADIRITETPLQTDELAGATHFIFANPEGIDFYRQMGVHVDAPGARRPYQSPLFASLTRENVVSGRVTFEDRGYSYDIYELDIERRFETPPVMVELTEDVVFGDFARLVGYSYADSMLAYAPEVTDLHMVFEVLAPIPDDYFIFVHLTPDDEIMPLATADGPVRETFFSMVYYSTRFWEVGEYVIDRRIFYYNPVGEYGDGYRLRVGLYSQTDGHRAPLTIDGEAAGDTYTWDVSFTIPPPYDE